MSVHPQKQKVIVSRQTLKVNQGYSFINKLPRSVGIEYDHNVPGAGQYVKPFNTKTNILKFGNDDHYELRTVPARGDALLTTLFIVKEIAKKSKPTHYQNWGLHVHVDALDLTTPDIIRFIYIYQYIQNTIQKQVIHQDRKARPFTKLLAPLPPSSDLAKTGLAAFCTKQQTQDMLHHVFDRDDSWIRSINFDAQRQPHDELNSTTWWWPWQLGRFSIAISAIAKYGTIEFRSKEAIAGDDPVEDVVYWPLFCGWLVESLKHTSDHEMVRILDPSAHTSAQKETNTFNYINKFTPKPIAEWFTNHAYATV